MAIEELPGGGVVITGTTDIQVTALLTLASGLVLELNSPSGMRMSSKISTLQAARNMGLVPEGTRPGKKKLLRLTVQKIRALKPGWEPSGQIAKALAS